MLIALVVVSPRSVTESNVLLTFIVIEALPSYVLPELNDMSVPDVKACVTLSASSAVAALPLISTAKLVTVPLVLKRFTAVEPI